MSSNGLENKAEDREKAVDKVLKELRMPCVCTVDCPFKGICCLCVRNHRKDGTLPACCLPRVSWRHRTLDYPECRTPLLWFLISKDEFKEMLRKLKTELVIEILNNIKELSSVDFKEIRS